MIRIRRIDDHQYNLELHGKLVCELFSCDELTPAEILQYASEALEDRTRAITNQTLPEEAVAGMMMGNKNDNKRTN